MNRQRIANVLLAPHQSEKSNRVADQMSQYIFRVARDANKREIAASVEKLFQVSVRSVQVVNVRGKNKRSRYGIARRPSWKKAYVSLASGDNIDFADFV